jgi:MFS family permease
LERYLTHWGPQRSAFQHVVDPDPSYMLDFVTAAWQVILVNLLSGVLWGAFSLASFNYLLALFPDSSRARYSALYQIVVTLALAGGAALGSLVIIPLGYKVVFLLSAVGRIFAGLAFARFVRPVAPIEQVTSPA